MLKELTLHQSTGISYIPEESPFTTLIVDVTHRCNMNCANCYIPNRDIPDMDFGWLMEVLGKLPKRTRIRLAGAEATMRRDLPRMIAGIRAIGHLPVLLTNGLRLARDAYVKELKGAGLRTVHLSLNGGLDDDHYEIIDEMRCAAKKLAALRNLVENGMNVTGGMILVRGVNDMHLADFFRDPLVSKGIKEFHFRSIGPMGRYMSSKALSLDELKKAVIGGLQAEEAALHLIEADASNFDFWFEKKKIAITAWPDLGNGTRGRLTPDGKVEPFFEHVIANAAVGGY